MQNEAVVLSQDNLEQIYSSFNQGKIICIPTDTIYALSCDATSIETIQKIYKIKQRPIAKTLPLFVSDIEMASLYADFSKKELNLANKLWPGALTLVSKIKDDCKNIPNVLINNKKIAIRVPKSKLIQSICQHIKKPIIGTSANISSKQNINSLEGIIHVFGSKVDYILKEYTPLQNNDLISSTIIEFIDDEKYKILREGKISKVQLEKVFISCI